MTKPMLSLIEVPPRSLDPEMEAMLARNRFVVRAEPRLFWGPVDWSTFVLDKPE